MRPVAFCGANVNFQPPAGMDDCIALPAYDTGSEIIACIKMEPEHLAHIAKTGEIWISFAGKDVYPFHISGTPLMWSISPVTGHSLNYRTDGLHMVPEAREYAVLRHGDQPYGPYTHEYHLGQVVDYLYERGFDWIHQASGWLHDTVEDTEQDLSVDERLGGITLSFGNIVGRIVWACTGIKVIDGVRQNRKACNRQIYDKIDAFPLAAPVKGADRYANMKACLTFNDPSKAKMYVSEYREFMENVGKHLPGLIVADLDFLFDQLIETFPELSKYKEST